VYNLTIQRYTRGLYSDSQRNQQACRSTEPSQFMADARNASCSHAYIPDTSMNGSIQACSSSTETEPAGNLKPQQNCIPESYFSYEYCT
jgi:hypothetical protein